MPLYASEQEKSSNAHHKKSDDISYSIFYYESFDSERFNKKEVRREGVNVYFGVEV